MQGKENVAQLYENILVGSGKERRGPNSVTNEDKDGHSNSSLYRIKCMVYSMLAMLIVLYVAFAVVITLVTLHIPVEQGHHVSFSARVAGINQNITQNKRIIFNEVSNNIMYGYDRSSGIFKAPLSGVYLFMYFIEIDGAYGKADLRFNNKSVSAATLYGIFSKVEVSGWDNNVTFEITKTDRGTRTDDFRCVAERLSISGRRNTVTVNQGFDNCPYKDGIKATGGNSLVIPVNAGDQVWIQNSESQGISVRPYGTTFTGILLTEK